MKADAMVWRRTPLWFWFSAVLNHYTVIAMTGITVSMLLVNMLKENWQPCFEMKNDIAHRGYSLNGKNVPLITETLI